MAVKGYLVDTNQVGDWEKAGSVFTDRLSQILPECLVRVCAITLGETEWALSSTTTTNSDRRREYKAFIERELKPYAIDVTIHTSVYYADILTRIWQKYPPANARVKTEAHLVDLGVDINDVWIVAVALEHGLTLLTADKMTVIREVATDVEFDCWR